jgi:DNA-binding MarR family transcriptional regulator
MRATKNAITEIACGCLAARVRVTARTVTAIYEKAVSKHGLTIAQVNLLAGLGWAGPSSPAQLGEALQLERSTMSRNLDLLLKSRWVHAIASDAKGVRVVELTVLGKKKLQSVLPYWRKAQAETARLVGEPGVQALRDVAEHVWTHAPGKAQLYS